MKLLRKALYLHKAHDNMDTTYYNALVHNLSNKRYEMHVVIVIIINIKPQCRHVVVPQFILFIFLFSSICKSAKNNAFG